MTEEKSDNEIAESGVEEVESFLKSRRFWGGVAIILSRFIPAKYLFGLDVGDLTDILMIVGLGLIGRSLVKPKLIRHVLKVKKDVQEIGIGSEGRIPGDSEGSTGDDRTPQVADADSSTGV